MAEETVVETPAAADEPVDSFAIRAEPQELKFDLGNAFARAGIPTKIQEQLAKSRKPDEPAPVKMEDVPHGTKTADDAQQALETVPEPEPPEPEPEPATVPTAEEEIAKFTKQIEELTGQKTKAEKEAEEAKAEAAKFKSQAESIEPFVLAPSPSDPLANVTNTTQLQAAKDRAKLIRDWADDNIEGIMINEGTPQEEVIDAKRMRQYRREAEDLLMQHIPQRETQLKEKATFDQAARADFPEVMTRGSQDFNTAQSILQEFPVLVNHPARNYLLGVFLLGYKQLQERRKATGKNGDKSDIPAALLTPKAPVAPAVPNRPSRVVIPQNNKKDEAANEELRKSKGDPRVAARLLKEKWDREGRFSTKSRKVLV